MLRRTPLRLETLEQRDCPAPLADNYESDDTPELAADHPTSGQLRRHTLHTVGDVDWIAFSIDYRSEVVIETSGDEGDTRLGLFSAANLGVSIAYDDDGGSGSFSRIVAVLDPGSYLARVDDYGQNDTIDAYTVSIKAYREADLRVASVSASPRVNVRADDIIRLKWKAQNRGATADPGRTGYSTWSDGIYYSEDAILDANDYLLTTVDRTGTPLKHGRSYRNSFDLNVSNSGFAGREGFLIIRADQHGQVADDDLGNNTRAVAVRFSPRVALLSPLPGRLIDGRTPIQFEAVGYDFGAASILDIVVDNDSNPKNGIVWTVAQDLPVSNEGTPAHMTADLGAVPSRSKPYHVRATLRRPDGTVVHSTSIPITIAPEASISDDALGDTVGGSGFEVFGVDAGRVGSDLQFRVRTNFNPAYLSGSEGGGDVRIVVNGEIYGLAVNTHQSSGGRVRSGELYRGASFLGGTTVADVPTFIDNFERKVPSRSSVKVIATPDRPWEYEIQGRVPLSAFHNYEPGDEISVGWAMYCGNDTDDVAVQPEARQADVVVSDLSWVPIEDNPPEARDRSVVRFTFRSAGYSGPVTVRLYQSAKEKPSKADFILGSTTINVIDGESGTGELVVGAAPRRRRDPNFVVAVADPDGALDDGDRTNNASPLQVAEPGELSWELEKSTPLANTKMDRVLLWLRRQRSAILAEADRREVSPEAIAGVIAWEAIHNVKSGPGPASFGPGKVHAFELTGKSLARWVEEHGYVDDLNLSQRVRKLNTLAGSLDYIGAIFDAFSDLSESAGSLADIRYDAPILATLYQGVVPSDGPLAGQNIRLNNAAEYFAWKVANGDEFDPSPPPSSANMGAFVAEFEVTLSLALLG